MNVNNTGDNMDEQTTGPDCLTSDLAGLAAREAGAPARGPTRIEEIRARLTPKRAEDAATWDLEVDGCVCAECMNGIRLLEGCEWTNGEDVCDTCAARLLGESRADVGYLLNELAGYQSDLLAGERALKEARRERDALRATLDATIADLDGLKRRMDDGRSALSASHERMRRIVLAFADTLGVRCDELPQDPDAAGAQAIKQGREGPEGWHFRYG